MSSLESNAAELRERVRIAAERADREPDDVTIVAVSKTFERSLMDEAYALGFRVFGESRVQEIRRKCEHPLPADAELHMIGPLQTNKLRQVLPYIQVLETLDRSSLVDSLARELVRNDQSLRVMIQMNISGEEQKSGLAPEQLGAFIESVREISQLELMGLMTMAPLDADDETLRAVFGGLRDLRDRTREQYGLTLPALSMGMSSDFEVAIAEGATHVRIGRSLFGDREAK